MYTQVIFIYRYSDLHNMEVHTLHKKVKDINILNFFVQFIYAIHAQIAYKLHKKVKDIYILNFFCVVYILGTCKMWSL